MKEASDRQLLEAWAAGDSRAGNELIVRHWGSLHRFFINKAPPSDQPDLLQSTLLECTRSVTRFRGDSSFRTFLLAIARNVLLHYFRTRARRLDRLDPLTHSVERLTTVGVFTRLARTRARVEVLRALRQLPIDLQIVIELKYWERMTAREIGEVLGVGINTVKGRINRGKRQLSELLATDGEL